MHHRGATAPERIPPERRGDYLQRYARSDTAEYAEKAPFWGFTLNISKL